MTLLTQIQSGVRSQSFEEQEDVQLPTGHGSFQELPVQDGILGQKQTATHPLAKDVTLYCQVQHYRDQIRSSTKVFLSLSTCHLHSI
jgi:hypothetical protein